MLPTIVILTGESGNGKTTVCRQIVAALKERGYDVAGLLTPPRYAGNEKIGMDVQDVRQGVTCALAERAAVAAGPATQHWHFHPAGLAWGAQVLAGATPCDVLVIDELGPLEIKRGEGWTVAFECLQAGRYQMALIVVRPALLADLYHRLKLTTALTLEVTRANQAEVAERVLAQARGCRGTRGADD